MRGVIFFQLSGFVIFCCLLSCSDQDKNSLSPHDFVFALQEEPGQLLDLRSLSEWKNEHLSGALHLGFRNDDAFKRSINKLNRRKTYYLYCEDGQKSLKALQQMQLAGFANVYFLRGGLRSLTSEGYSVARLF